MGVLGVQVWIWNFAILSGKEEEVCEELRKKMINDCCSQEVRWRGRSARVLGIK